MKGDISITKPAEQRMRVPDVALVILALNRSEHKQIRGHANDSANNFDRALGYLDSKACPDQATRERTAADGTYARLGYFPRGMFSSLANSWVFSRGTLGSSSLGPT